MNISHQQKKMDKEQIGRFRDRFHLPVPDDKLEELPYLKFAEDSAEYKYMMQRRMDLGGFRSVAARPKRWPFRRSNLRRAAQGFRRGPRAVHDDGHRAHHEHDAEGQACRQERRPHRARRIAHLRHGRHVPPVGIWNQEGQNYVPEDHDQLMFYKESKTGQVLQEGINEAGAMSDWIAAATSYSVHNVQTIPFYICYSMFGMQRVLDLCWAAGDQRARGFLIGGTAGRTTLNGEGLQHEDGHSLILSNLIPNCISYDPTFQYEVAVVTQDGMRRMFPEQEDVFYYLTVMNENYEHPECRSAPKPTSSRACTRSRRVARPACACSCWAPAPSSAKSSPPPTCSRTTGASKPTSGAARASTNWPATARTPPAGTAAPAGSAEAVARRAEAGGRQGPGHRRHRLHQAVLEQIRPFVKAPYVTLGTDGFGRSDTREKLRHFEVDRHWVTLAALKALADKAKSREVVAAALVKYNLDPNKPNPMSV
jgi:pyruvate dehydrogenase E1 component